MNKLLRELPVGHIFLVRTTPYWNTGFNDDVGTAIYISDQGYFKWGFDDDTEVVDLGPMKEEWVNKKEGYITGFTIPDDVLNRVKCETCDGTGEVHSHNPKCWDCKGLGYILNPQPKLVCEFKGEEDTRLLKFLLTNATISMPDQFIIESREDIRQAMGEGERDYNSKTWNPDTQTCIKDEDGENYITDKPTKDSSRCDDTVNVPKKWVEDVRELVGIRRMETWFDADDLKERIKSALDEMGGEG